MLNYFSPVESFGHTNHHPSRMQCEIQPDGLRGMRLIAHTIRSMIAVDGLTAFFRGLPLGLFGVFPYAAIDLCTFEMLKTATQARLQRKANANNEHRNREGGPEELIALSNLQTASIGAFSGALGASIVYPLNVLRTRLQAQGTRLHAARYDGWMDAVRQTYGREGVRGFFKGITPNLMKVVPAVSISYVVYENSKRMVGLR